MRTNIKDIEAARKGKGRIPEGATTPRKRGALQYENGMVAKKEVQLSHTDPIDEWNISRRARREWEETRIRLSTFSKG